MLDIKRLQILVAFAFLPSARGFSSIIIILPISFACLFLFVVKWPIYPFIDSQAHRQGRQIVQSSCREIHSRHTAEELTNYPIADLFSSKLPRSLKAIAGRHSSVQPAYIARTRVGMNIFKVISDYDKYYYVNTVFSVQQSRELIKTMPSQLSEAVIEEAMTDLWLSLRQSSSPSLSFHTRPHLSPILRKTDSLFLVFNIAAPSFTMLEKGHKVHY